MSLTIDQLFQPLTSDQITTGLYGTLTALGFSVTSWRPGGIARTLVAGFSRTLAPFTTVMSLFAKSGFRDFASGDYLEVLAKQFYNVDKVHATFAAGQITLTNSGGGVYTLGAGQFSVQNPSTGATYTNDGAFTLLGLSALTTNITATQTGSASNSAPNTITAPLTALLGVTCTNANAVTGQDDETDDALKSRCLAKLGSLSPNGPAKAFDYVLRTPALTATSVPITRTQVIEDSDHGVVQIYAANTGGAISGGDVTIAQSAVEQWATPLCIEPTVSSATNTTTAVTYQAWVYATQNLDGTALQTAIAAALVTYFTVAPVGGFKIPPSGGMLFNEALEYLISATIAGFGQGPPIKVSVSVPSDTSVADGFVPTLGTITATVTQVVGP